MSSLDVSGLKWQKAQRSAGNGACVEIASLQDIVVVRDSKDPNGPVLTYTQTEWRAFLHGAKVGNFDGLC